jgi:putative hydrolase of HD superfamily
MYVTCLATQTRQLRVAAQDIQTLHPFFTGSIPNLEHPVVRGWAETLMTERRELWASRGREKEEREGLEGYAVGSVTDGKSA